MGIDLWVDGGWFLMILMSIDRVDGSWGLIIDGGWVLIRLMVAGFRIFYLNKHV